MKRSQHFLRGEVECALFCEKGSELKKKDEEKNILEVPRQPDILKEGVALRTVYFSYLK
jgi:hypothetical protein